MPLGRLTVAAGALLAALGVAAGALGAHVLPGIGASDRQGLWHTAVEYHLVHALGVLAAGLLAQGRRKPSRILRGAAALLAAGIVLFSGSLYLLALTGVAWLGAVTPLGGIAFLGGWTLLAAAAVRRDHSR